MCAESPLPDHTTANARRTVLRSVNAERVARTVERVPGDDVTVKEKPEESEMKTVV